MKKLAPPKLVTSQRLIKFAGKGLYRVEVIPQTGQCRRCVLTEKDGRCSARTREDSPFRFPPCSIGDDRWYYFTDKEGLDTWKTMAVIYTFDQADEQKTSSF